MHVRELTAKGTVQALYVLFGSHRHTICNNEHCDASLLHVVPLLYVAGIIIAQSPSIMANYRFSVALHADVRCLERAARKSTIRFLVETIDLRVSFCGAASACFLSHPGVQLLVTRRATLAPLQARARENMAIA